jgi:hypothetical protein
MEAFRRLMVGPPTIAAAATVTTTHPLSLPPPPFPLPPPPPAPPAAPAAPLPPAPLPPPPRRVEVEAMSGPEMVAAFAANAEAHQAATTPLPASPRPSALVLLDLFSPPASPKATPGSEPVKKQQ